MEEISILSQNVSSLVKRERRVEFDSVVRRSGAKVVFIQETHLNEKHKVQLSKMRMFRTDKRPGTAIAVSEELATERVEIDGVHNIVFTAG